MQEKKLRIEKIILRMKHICNVKTDTELAEILDISRNSIFAWRQRLAIPEREIISFATRFNVTTTWLTEGTGPMPEVGKPTDVSAAPPAIYSDVGSAAPPVEVNPQGAAYAECISERDKLQREVDMMQSQIKILKELVLEMGNACHHKIHTINTGEIIIK